MTKISVGDIVQWHTITCEWVVVSTGPTRLTIETDIVDEGDTRTERRVVRRADCRLIGQQLSLLEGAS